MSITEIINNIPNRKLNNHLNTSDSFYIESYTMYDKYNIPWIICPFCGKRQFPLSKGAVIKGQVFKCKGSNCKQKFMVNLEG